MCVGESIFARRAGKFRQHSYAEKSLAIYIARKRLSPRAWLSNMHYIIIPMESLQLQLKRKIKINPAVMKPTPS